MNTEPKSLQEAIVYFSNPDTCIAHLVAQRWPDGIVKCPTCGNEKVNYRAHRRTWTCSSHHAKREFSIKVGTMMEDSPIGLDKWLTAIWLLTNCKNGISSYEIARDINVSQKAAWFMLHRIRLAMQDDSFGSKLGGEVEADETFIGGKARNMHLSVKARRITGTGTKDKTAVMGILERGGNVRTIVVSNRKKLYCKRKSKSMSKLARRSTLTRCFPMKVWRPTTRTRLLTMLLNTSTGASIPTDSKTSGAC